MKLYHYTTIETFSKIWVSKQLRFSESKNTNDLFEKRKTWEFVCGILPNEGEKDVMEAFNTFGKKFSDILAKYRQISFSLDYKNLRGCYSSMMWGQYAHNENGVCIEFDSEKMYFPPNVFKSKVKYTYDVPICFLYISHLYGKREISCYDLKSKREIEKRVAEDPDCYSKKISMKDLLY